jgi:hypothetical protein
MSAPATNQCFQTITDLIGERNPGEVASIKCVVCTTEEEFRTRFSELKTKGMRGHHTLRDESLEHRGAL